MRKEYDQDCMIQFHCQHCGNYMRIGAEYEGRDACCKACKRYIIIPKADGTSLDVFSLPSEERLRRTEHLLQSTTERNQQLRALLAPYQDAGGQLIPPAQLRAAADRFSSEGIQELEGLRQQIEDWRGERECLEQQHTELLEQTRSTGQMLSESQSMCSQLGEELRESRATVALLQVSLSEREDQFQELERNLSRCRDSLQESEGALEEGRGSWAAREQTLLTELNLLQYEFEQTNEALAGFRAELGEQDTARRSAESEIVRLEADNHIANTQISVLSGIIEEFALAFESRLVEDGAMFDDPAKGMIKSLAARFSQLEFQLRDTALEFSGVERIAVALRSRAADLERCLTAQDSPTETIEINYEENTPEPFFEGQMSSDDPMAEAYMRFLGPQSGI